MLKICFKYTGLHNQQTQLYEVNTKSKVNEEDKKANKVEVESEKFSIAPYQNSINIQQLVVTDKLTPSKNNRSKSDIKCGT